MEAGAELFAGPAGAGSGGLTAAWRRGGQPSCSRSACRTFTSIDPAAAHRRSERQRAARAPAAQASPAQEAALSTPIAAHPDLTLAALQVWLLAEHGVPPSNGAIWSAVARLGLSYQKDAPGGRAEPAPAQAGDRTDIAARRRTWQCTPCRPEDVTATLDLALRASGLDEATPTGRPPLLSDNGSSYIAGELAERLEDRKIKHVRGAPYHPIPRAGSSAGIRR